MLDARLAMVRVHAVQFGTAALDEQVLFLGHVLRSQWHPLFYTRFSNIHIRLFLFLIIKLFNQNLNVCLNCVRKFKNSLLLMLIKFIMLTHRYIFLDILFR